MRIAALYDIHGNRPALEAVLRDVSLAAVDRIVIGGDVLPGPMPRETIDCLSNVSTPMDCIMGNGDRETLAGIAGQESAAIPESFRETLRWCGRQLTAGDVNLVERWPKQLRIEVPGLGSVLFCHATPRNDMDIFTRQTAVERLAPIFDGFGFTVVVCGHTHMQFDRRIGSTRVVNAGSVGMPFQAPGAYWLLIGADVELRRTAYDFDAAAARIRRTAYPQAEAFAAGNVLQPPSEEDMVRMFAAAELR